MWTIAELFFCMTAAIGVAQLCQNPEENMITARSSKPGCLSNLSIV